MEQRSIYRPDVTLDVTLDDYGEQMKPANQNSPNFKNFITALKDEKVCPPRGVSELSQKNNAISIVVPTVEYAGAGDDCWYNAISYANDNSGSIPVFGWALWDIGGEKLVAQHHAIILEGDKYLDVTLGQEYENITFFIDDRAPFDYEKFRMPFNFEFGVETKCWYALNEEHDCFSIASLNSPSCKIIEEISKAKQNGII